MFRCYRTGEGVCDRVCACSVSLTWPLTWYDLWHLTLRLDTCMKVCWGVRGCAEVGRAWYVPLLPYIGRGSVRQRVCM